MKLIILSSTPRSNFLLSQEIAKVAESLGFIPELIELESLGLPLYTVSEEEKGIPLAAIKLSQSLGEVQGFVFVAPEYNGGLPPVSVNVLNWISRTGADWRSAFDRKMVLMASSSGGGGANLFRVMNTQFQHLGAIVLPRPILVNGGKPFTPEATIQGLELIKRWSSSS